MTRSERRRTALSLVESLFAVVLVSGLLVASLHTLGAVGGARRAAAERARGYALAAGLMAEILQQEYQDPDGAPAFGPETGEGGGTRAAFDDVDDYHGWSASPPQLQDGTILAGFDGWSRSVQVEYTMLNDLTKTAAFATNVKRITVTVRHGGRVAASLVAVRTASSGAPLGVGVQSQ